MGPYSTPQKYTYSGMSYNGKRGSVECSGGTWTIDVDVQRGTPASATITVTESECKPEEQKKPTPTDLLTFLKSLLSRRPIGVPPDPLPLLWPR